MNKLNVKYLTYLLLLSLSFFSCQNNRPKQYIGYTNGFEKEHFGITTFSFTPKDGSIKSLSFTPTKAPVSYMTFDSREKIIYSVTRRRGRKTPAYLTSYKIKQNSLIQAQQIQLPFNSPIHIAVDKNDKVLTIPGGNSHISAWAVNKEDIVSKPTTLFKTYGSSINKWRQRYSVPHSMFYSPDGRFSLASDLGTDKITTYKNNKGKLQKVAVHKTRLGAGPRHLAFSSSGHFVYILYELTSEVEVCSFERKTGKLTHLQYISCLPKKVKANQKAAEILVHPNGKFLYTSNRGKINSIAVFAINQKSGKLKYLYDYDTLGKTPRNFNITNDGKFLIVGNKDSKQLVTFSINNNSGKLTKLKTNQWNCQIFRILIKK